ncbi:MAG: polyphosphate kinase 1 [Bacteroidetes bacterium]|nr:polyphosphate kinase 1 [Bacteroidota bacterium]
MKNKEIPLVNRELSWLSFNERVLQEAADPLVPLLERLRFLGIYSNNRDEFFRVRVATVKRLTKMDKHLRILQGEKPVELLENIQKVILKQQEKFEKIFQGIQKELHQHKIHIIDETELNAPQGRFVRDYFKSHVQPVLFPVILGPGNPFPYLKDKSIYLIIRLQKKGKEPRYALIEVPSKLISRFLLLPSTKNENHLILLEDVIRYNLDDIFAIFDFDKIDSYIIKITRDAELDLDNDLSKSFLEKISKSIKNRKKGLPVRLAYDGKLAKDMMEMLISRMKFRKFDNLIPGGRIHNFKDFIRFPDIGSPTLKYRKNKPLDHPAFKNAASLFPVIAKKDVLLFFPYQSYHYILDLLREASIDPKVESIKITLYRLANNSIIANALINALKNGKSVTAVVELQARFDEESNIYWANQLQEEGATVIFGVPGLKVHSKLFLITRKEVNQVTRYAHIGTGNFNEETSGLYSDISLLTVDQRITDEVVKLFNFYANNYKIGSYKHLLVAPWDMRKRYIALINKEIANHRIGKPAYIWLKLNSLVDEEMISRLYVASSEGVPVKLIIRGICSLVPGVKGLSENIEVISIVDKFLEHSRILIFCNEGDEKIYLASADWMSRNLDHRSEVAVPVYDKSLQKQLKDFIQLQFKDNCKARLINQQQDNQYVKASSKVRVRSQDEFYKLLLKK